MNPTASEIGQLKSKIKEYKQTITTQGEINESDTLTLDVQGGTISVQPESDGTTVNIQLINETDKEENKYPTIPAFSTYLIDTIGFPNSGQYEPYKPFSGSKRTKHRVNFEYFL